ncbi:hypothetical protein V3C99_017965 [Haemonchus contortus]|uniref:Uncharacterized protein n=1 Tax=Haemonchus contortus TaxID=6289 RepID=A0A7I4Z6I5_HAECO
MWNITNAENGFSSNNLVIAKIDRVIGALTPFQLATGPTTSRNRDTRSTHIPFERNTTFKRPTPFGLTIVFAKRILLGGIPCDSHRNLVKYLSNIHSNHTDQPHHTPAVLEIIPHPNSLNEIVLILHHVIKSIPFLRSFSDTISTTHFPLHRNHYCLLSDTAIFLLFEISIVCSGKIRLANRLSGSFDVR